jgi:hypothetical protein
MAGNPAREQTPTQPQVRTELIVSCRIRPVCPVKELRCSKRTTYVVLTSDS